MPKTSTSKTLLACGLATTAIAAALLVAAVQPGFSEGVKSKPIMVKTPDGLTISAQEWGNPNGPEILFIHGFSQSHLSWMRQVDSDLAKEFRIVTYDLRGHGNSDKPLDPASYRNSKAWGDEVQAVIDAAGLKRPLLVGWSYAGRVISDYLATHGADKLAGINFVDASIKADPALVGDNIKNLPLMASEDLVTNITATRAFLHGCFSKQPSTDDYETMLAFNMMVLPKVRAGLNGRPLDATEMMSPVYGFGDPRRQALGLRRDRPFPVLRGCPALQQRTCKFRSRGGEDELTRLFPTKTRMSRSLSSGARSRDPLAHPGYALGAACDNLPPGPPAKQRVIQRKRPRSTQHERNQRSKIQQIGLVAGLAKMRASSCH
jgi:non-heme chloroperoxidase